MSSVQAKLAALRARRESRERPASGKVDTALAEAARVVGMPSVTWDADYKEKMRGSKVQRDAEESDEDSECDLVVLPPPVRKLDASAQRSLWRMRERNRARQRTARNLVSEGLMGFDCGSKDGTKMEKCTEDDEDLNEADQEENEELVPVIAGACLDEERIVFQSSAVSEADDEDKDLHVGAQEESEGEDATNVQQSTKIHNTGSVLESCLAVAERKCDIAPIDTTAAPTASTTSNVVSAVRTNPEVLQLGQKSSFIEDEADADSDNEDPDDCVIPGAYSDDEDGEGLEDLGIVPDDGHVESAGEGHKLAAFHRQWQTEEEEKNRNRGLRMDSCAVGDDERAMDVRDLTGFRSERDGIQSSPSSEVDDMERQNGNKNATSTADNYVDVMFRDDDSRGIFAEDNEDEGEDDHHAAEYRRLQAKALWKARQNQRSCAGGNDDNSLSFLGLFDDSSSARGAHLRLQIERSRRPLNTEEFTARASKPKPYTSLNSVKTKSNLATDLSVPEWERRRVCLKRVEKRKQAAVSINMWTYKSRLEEMPKPQQPKKAPEGAAVARSMVVGGASFCVRKKRTRVSTSAAISKDSLPPPSGARTNTKRARSSSQPASFKGLLSILGTRAKIEDSG